MSSMDPEDAEDSQAADQELHLLIAASSGNRAVQHVVERLEPLFEFAGVDAGQHSCCAISHVGYVGCLSAEMRIH